MTERLRDRGERALLDAIRRLIPPARGVLLGPGDDAAVLAPVRAPLLVTTDALVEHVHFRSAWLSPRALGRRAFEVSASDVAAMGGRFVAAVLAVAAPPTLPVASLRALVAGVRDGARAAGGALVGGNLACARELSLTITVLGAAPPRPVTRSGARVGDRVYVSGTLGGAALGVRTLLRSGSGATATAAVRSWTSPRARLRLGAALARGGATAMIDVSDGLLIDLERVCAASGVGARVDAGMLPLAPVMQRVDAEAARALALTGGEDYELLFTVPQARARTLGAVGKLRGCAVTRIGEIVAGRSVRVVADGRAVRVGAAPGHEHFVGGRGRRRVSA